MKRKKSDKRKLLVWTAFDEEPIFTTTEVTCLVKPPVPVFVSHGFPHIP